MEVQEEQQTILPSNAGGVRRDFLSRNRLLVLGLLFVIEIGIFVTALTWPMDPATQQSLAQEANNLFGQTNNPQPATLVSSIFDNNLRVALVEMVPAFGLLVFAISIFTTGEVIQAVMVSNGAPGALGGFLFLFPFTIVELSAYVLAVGSGTMLLVGWRGGSLHREARVFAVEAVAVAVILFVAAAMETVTILSPLVGFALWLPTALVVIWLVTFFRRNRE